MKGKLGRLKEKIQGVKQTDPSSWMALFKQWLPALSDPSPKRRNRVFTIQTTFWLFFSPGPLAPNLLP